MLVSVIASYFETTYLTRGLPASLIQVPNLVISCRHHDSNGTTHCRIRVHDLDYKVLSPCNSIAHCYLRTVETHLGCLLSVAKSSRGAIPIKSDSSTSRVFVFFTGFFKPSISDRVNPRRLPSRLGSMSPSWCVQQYDHNSGERSFSSLFWLVSCLVLDLLL